MKIILVHNRYKHQGGEDVVVDQERQLLEQHGHEIETYSRSNFEVDCYPGVKRLALMQRMIWAHDTYRDFRERLRREKPDLVHIHNVWIMISPSIYDTCREADVPVVQTLHNYRLLCPVGTLFRDGRTCHECVDHGLGRSVLHGCYRHSRTATAAVALTLAIHRLKRTWTTGIDSYITLSQFSRDLILKAGLPAERVFVKPNFVHPDPGVSAGNGEYAIFIGRLAHEKRVDTILNAWANLTKRIELFIVGDGPDANELQREAGLRGLSTVHFQGHLPREQAMVFLRNARFLIFSSKLYETFGLTIIEAFACGIPVICSKMGAMQEIVDDGRTGLHFIPGNAVDLAAKVEWACNHPERMQEMGKEARKEYESKYSAEKNYPLLMNIYQHAIAQHSSQRVSLECKETVPERSTLN